MKYRVLLADDHRVVRQGLRVLLTQNDVNVVAEASNGQEAVELTRQFRPDIAVLDMTMPVLNGLCAAQEIVRTTQTKAILLTMHGDAHYVMNALRAGVRGYVLKNNAASGLIEAIREVCQGNIYLSPGIARTVVEAFLSMPDPASDPLTAREREVVRLIAEGRSTKEVANSLGLSVKTADSHRGRIMKKLRVHETAGLVLYALRTGIIEP
jgi:two-component system, NarL family, response regulator NreC